jgi:hypothetical protein
MTTDDDTPLKSYSATIGVYVRAYGHIKFEAEGDETATAAAIAVFKDRTQDVFFADFDWNNLAHPSIVSIDDAEDSDRTIAEGVDFALSPEDARDLASADLLTALEGILEWWDVTPCRPRGEEPSAMIDARAAIAKAKGTEPETTQPEPAQDSEPEQRSNAELVHAILEMLGETELTSDDIIDNCRFFAEVLQKRFPLPQDTRMIATLVNELQKAGA